MAEYTNAEKAERNAKSWDEFVDSLDQDHLPKANIIVAGITGTGKSTLLNAVFGVDMAETGKGRPVTDHMNEYNNADVPVCVWDTVGLELDSEKTRKSIEAIQNVIASQASSKEQFDRIHAIWYCINSGSNRYQGAELNFIKSLHAIGVPFIIVLTQSFGDEDEENAFEEQIRKENAKMGMNDISIVQVLAKDYKLRGQPPVPAFGLDTLINLTISQMPNYLKGSVTAAQRVSRDQKRIQSEEIIAKYVQAAREGFWDKVPLANIYVANNKVRDMIHKIGMMYNMQIESEAIDEIVNKCHIDASNTFKGLVTPFYKKYYKAAMNSLGIEKEKGFEVNLGTLEKSDRVAVMIALYGYIFIEALEKVWDESTEAELKNIERISEKLLDVINELLYSRKNG